MNINEISSALDLAISVQSSADDCARKVVNRFIPNRLRVRAGSQSTAGAETRVAWI
jgi:hypothetical protein